MHNDASPADGGPIDGTNGSRLMAKMVEPADIHGTNGSDVATAAFANDGDGACAAGNKDPTPASTSASSGGADAEPNFGSVTLTLDAEDANAGPTIEVEADEHVKPTGKKPDLAVGANDVRPSSTDDARLVGTDDLADVKQKAFRAAVAAV